MEDIDFRIVFNHGKNIIEEEKKKAQQAQETESKIFSELAKVKWSYLSKASGCIEKDLWRKYSKENYDKARKLSYRLENEFTDEKNKDEIQNQDEIKQNLDQLDALYFKALLAVLDGLPQEKDLTRDRVISKSEDFIDTWNDAIDEVQDIIQKGEKRIENEAIFLEHKELFDNAKEKVLFIEIDGPELTREIDRKILDWRINPDGNAVVLYYDKRKCDGFKMTTLPLSGQGKPSVITFLLPECSSREDCEKYIAAQLSSDGKLALMMKWDSNDARVTTVHDTTGREIQKFSHYPGMVFLPDKKLFMTSYIQNEEYGVLLSDLTAGTSKRVAVGKATKVEVKSRQSLDQYIALFLNSKFSPLRKFFVVNRDDKDTEY
jgi:hypothetical protein